MLAYELFLKNRDSTSELGFKSPRPIKKVIVSNNNYGYDIKFDNKSIEEYQSPILPEFELIQRSWNMPINQNADIPYKYKGGSEPKPYIVLYGQLTSTNIVLSIGDTVKKKKAWFKATKKATDDEPKIEGNGNILDNYMPSLNFQLPYYINQKKLYDLYLEKGLLVPTEKKQVEIPTTMLKEVARAFFKNFSNPLEKKGKLKPIKFELFILPLEGKLIHNSEHPVIAVTALDAFDNPYSHFSKDSSQANAKFLSVDDPAFALNLINDKHRNKFYEILGIGAESLDKVNLSDAIQISGFNFYFFDLNNPENNTPVEGSGFYSWLINNYFKLKKTHKYSERLSQLKILCVKMAKNKMELLIDCNLTFEQLENALRIQHLNQNSLKNAPYMLLEKLFIYNDKKVDGKKPIWNNYILSINRLIYGPPLTRESLLKIFCSRLAKKRFANAKNPADALEYLKRAEFCIKLFGGVIMDVSADEKFAYSIGRIAGMYIKFKRGAKEESNSLLDILTYAKYDETKLRFVWTKIGQGVALSKEDLMKKQDLEQNIKNAQANIQLKMNNPTADYSYFFYRGAYNELGKGD